MKHLAALLALVALLALAAVPASADQRLSYPRAKAAMQAKANKVAGQPTKVTTVYRLGNTLYSGIAEWDTTDPTGCKGCGFDPATNTFYDTPKTEGCSLTLKARLRPTGKIAVARESLLCY